MITNADVDAAIKVRVSFTDDDGYSETLISNATTSVPVPAPVIVPPEEPQIAQAAGDDDEPVVLDDWSLKPSGLGVGDQFRLIFLSSTKRNATSSSISAPTTHGSKTEPQPAMTTSKRTAMVHRSRLHRAPRTPATTLAPPTPFQTRESPSTG